MRKPKDLSAELAASAERTSRLKAERTVELGNLIHSTGAGALAFNVLAGLLLAGVDELRLQPSASARYADIGNAFFSDAPKPGRKARQARTRLSAVPANAA